MDFGFPAYCMGQKMGQIEAKSQFEIEKSINQKNRIRWVHDVSLESMMRFAPPPPR